VTAGGAQGSVGAPGAGPVVPVYVAVPDRLRPRAEWVLSTLLAASGARLEAVADVERAPACALAYAPAPVPGVPTIPAAGAAHDLIAADGTLPAGSFVPLEVSGEVLVAAFPFGGAGFAVPADLVASAFALLAGWDEHTSDARDAQDRFPLAASVFAANPALAVDAPVVDAYGRLLRVFIAERLAALGRRPLESPAWDGGGSPFAVALTHDVDGLPRWIPRAWPAAGKRGVQALRAGDLPQARFEVGLLAYHATRDVPRGVDPYWTFPELLAREDALGIDSTFFIIASHGHPLDGSSPAVYERRLPDLLRLLRRAGREIALHGNDRDRLGLEALIEDRGRLAEEAATTVEGMRYHYLRCLYHETLPLLEHAGFAYDTSLAFAEHEGFRCGTSFPFHPYDLRTDEPLALLELPLAVMDTTLLAPKYRALAPEQAAAAARAVLERAQRSRGGVSILWHHSHFHPYVGRGYG
jgi:peptidoglycan/xylan/chitin deacetylase (PgdA/CDA1 family)